MTNQNEAAGGDAFGDSDEEQAPAAPAINADDAVDPGDEQVREDDVAFGIASE